MTFKDRQLNSMTSQAWKIKFLNSMTFQVFHNLYKPCVHRRFYMMNYQPKPINVCLIKQYLLKGIFFSRELTKF